MFSSFCIFLFMSYFTVVIGFYSMYPFAELVNPIGVKEIQKLTGNTSIPLPEKEAYSAKPISNT